MTKEQKIYKLMILGDLDTVSKYLRHRYKK